MRHPGSRLKGRLVSRSCVFVVPNGAIIIILAKMTLPLGKQRPDTFALQISRVTLEPAQLRTSVAKRFGSGSSCSASQVSIREKYWQFLWFYESVSLTIGCPLIPTIKSNHGSKGSSLSLLRRTWKPNEVLSPEECRGS